MIELVPLVSVDDAQVDALLDTAFGPDRHQRTAYRVRAGTRAISELSHAAVDDDGRLIASLQCWPVQIACDSGRDVAMVMVGPVAVAPDLQRSGIGRCLMQHLLTLADQSDLPGARALMLIGDSEYYGRFFGFSADRTGGWRLPGPFEARRLLARGHAVPDCPGLVGPRVAVPA